jgi:hypothetical protein
MADDPPIVTFRKRPTLSPERDADPLASIPVYRRALELSAALYAIVELAADERYFMRDMLDKKSTAVPLAIAQAFRLEEMAARRELFRAASNSAKDCKALLDVLGQRGTIAPDALARASEVVCALIDELVPYTIEPRKTY